MFLQGNVDYKTAFKHQNLIDYLTSSSNPDYIVNVITLYRLYCLDLTNLRGPPLDAVKREREERRGEMPCCKWKKTGSCHGCVCVQTGISCTNFLPIKLGTCSNPPTLTPLTTTGTVPLSVIPDSASQLDSLPANHDSSESELCNNECIPSVVLPTVPVADDVTTDHPFEVYNEASCIFVDMQSTVIRDLPQYTEVPQVNFTLGTMEEEETARVIDSAYDEVVHFRPNAFNLPNGSVSREFVSQLSQYFLVFGKTGPFEVQALKVAMLFQMLLQQTPFQSDRSSHIKCLKRRLGL